ncbi:preprotein translocase subunit SecE [Marinospirillum alkaliphilum]|uniref:Protein translocase subunit SecE n=1 Tax=Marinospirillum alkaliphilum DSM 21637 TaxID=1122209 RepID=A0A1K1Z305_9GAMM|nr:preprotein translocase subunit SecE [Marinospirillum alkaliphilum]SFX68502.1 preprotein translocase subunit SecE [Marinospirillum alkaliphilum DSM 21637]
MKAKAETHSDKLDGFKWALVVALIAAAVTGNMYYSDAPLLYRVVGVVLLSVAAGLVFLQTGKGQRFLLLAKEARTEIRKVVWPTRPETTQTTLIVLAAVALVAFLLWLIDSFLSWVIRSLIY